VFRAELSESELLRNSIPIIAEIIDEGEFKVTKSGISLVCPDRTMVSVVDFNMLSSAFDDFQVEKEISLGLNMDSLVAVIKRVRAGERVAFESDGSSKLKITVKGNGTRTFELPLIDIKAEKPPLDQLDFHGRVELESSVMEDGITDADIVGDSVVFEADSSSFKISAKGDVSATELKMGAGDRGLLKVESKKSIRSRYPLDYLKKMIKASKVSGHLTLMFGTDYPMKMEFNAIDKMRLGFILAPRVEE